MTIYFNPRGKAVSDFEVEDFYQENKHLLSISTSSELVFLRFRVGLKQGELDSLVLNIEDKDGERAVYELDKNARIPFEAYGKFPVLDASRSWLVKLLERRTNND